MSKSVNRPSADGVRVPRADRRAAVRYPCNVDTRCHAGGPAGALCPAWVRDLSATGIALLTARPFAAGAALVVEMDHPGRGAALHIGARVVHALEMPNDHWLHGCAFDRPLTPDELRTFVD
jgi:hypothetical protein